MLLKLMRKGQSTLEYGMVVAIIVAALIGMQMYLKRGMQGRMKQSTDDIGEQFSPATSHSAYTTTMGSTQHEQTQSTGRTVTTISRGTQSRTGSEGIGTHGSEPWP